MKAKRSLPEQKAGLFRREAICKARVHVRQGCSASNLRPIRPKGPARLVKTMSWMTLIERLGTRNQGVAEGGVPSACPRTVAEMTALAGLISVDLSGFGQG